MRNTLIFEYGPAERSPALIGCENKESSVNEAQSRPNGSRSNYQTSTVKA
jgi:hypothetical protein